MKKEKKYTKICKKRAFVGGFDALWRSSDHLLLVCNNMYTQSYKRFFFSDIQVLFAQVTNRWLHVALGQGFALLFCLICAFFIDEQVTRFVFWGASGLFLIVLVINLVQGPSCKATIVTKVQSHTLPLVRLNKAKKVFAILRARIEEAQGVLDHQELKDVASNSRPDQNTRQVNGATASRKKTVIDHSYRGIFHLVFFSILLIIGGMNGLQLYARHVGITLIEVVLLITALIYMVLALARQKKSTMPGWLQKNTWCGLAVILILMGLSYVDTIMSTFGNIEMMAQVRTQLDMINIYIARDPDQYPFFKFMLIFHAVSLSLVAIPGLWQTTIWQKQRGKVEE